MRPRPLVKIARLLLAGYAVAVTVAVAFALTAGPFKEPLILMAKIRVLESDLRETKKAQISFEEERKRLLTAIKNVQADWAAQRELARSLRETVINAGNDTRLEEANRLVEKLTQEKTVLIAKLNELMQARAAETEPKRLKGP